MRALMRAVQIVWIVVGAVVGVYLMFPLVFLLTRVLPRSVDRWLTQTDIPLSRTAALPMEAIVWLLGVTAGAFLFAWLWNRWFERGLSRRGG